MKPKPFTDRQKEAIKYMEGGILAGVIDAVTGYEQLRSCDLNHKQRLAAVEAAIYLRGLRNGEANAKGNLGGNKNAG